MKNRLPTALLAVLVLAACGKSDPTGPTPATPPQANAGHHDDHGETTPLGDLTIGSTSFAVRRGATIEAGTEALVFADFAAGKPVPGTMRVWIGVESGVGSMKAKMSKEGERTMHAHVQVPKPMPEGSKIWIEAEEGTKVERASISWQR